MDSLDQFTNSILNNDLNEFMLQIEKNKNLTYHEFGKYLLQDVIMYDANNILYYLISLNAFDYFNKSEYLNYDFEELQNLNLNSVDLTNFDEIFYDKYFAECDHPLFILIDNKNIKYFLNLLQLDINLNVININGITLLHYIYINEKLTKNIKKQLINILIEKGASWDYTLKWIKIKKIYIGNKIKKIKNQLLQNCTESLLNKLSDIQFEFYKLHIDNYCIQNFIMK